jgi:hypothetical protein
MPVWGLRESPADRRWERLPQNAGSASHEKTARIRNAKRVLDLPNIISLKASLAGEEQRGAKQATALLFRVTSYVLTKVRALAIAGCGRIGAYFALNVKSSLVELPAATVTFAVCVPSSSCHALTV